MSTPFSIQFTKRLQRGRPLSELSTFGIGGAAKFLVEVTSFAEMQEAIAFCFLEKLSYFVLGKGSNTLFDDRGFNGLIILNKILFCEMEGTQVFVGAGYSFSLLGIQTAKKGFSGLEFASGIPGTVGGAVYMNAGAGGSETCASLIEVLFINEEGELVTLKKEEIEFGYRFSSFQKRKGAIVAAKFQLQAEEGAKEKQRTLLTYRMTTQPYKDLSAGCIFRNPQGGSAGALIEACGLKGKRIGGAAVSPMHANFIVNQGAATAQDVEALAAFVQNTVKKRHGIDLEMEVRRIPYEF